MVGGYFAGLVPGQDVYLIKTDTNGNSGCYEQDVTMAVAPQVLTTTNAATQLLYPATRVKILSLSQTSGGSALTLCLTMGIEEPAHSSFSSSSELSVYPNPAHNSFTVSLNSEMKNAELKLTDVTGRIVIEQPLRNPTTTINSALSAGVYFVKVSDGENVFTQKLVIE